MTTTHPLPATEVVDLVAIAETCRPVIAWYDDFLARPQLGLAPPALARLDIALADLRSLPHCGGRIGQALAVVASGGAACSTERTLAALETLRTTLALCSPRVAAPPPSSGPIVQLALPGFEGPGDTPQGSAGNRPPNFPRSSTIEEGAKPSAPGASAPVPHPRTINGSGTTDWTATSAGKLHRHLLNPSQ